jgi:hypothetical protein
MQRILLLAWFSLLVSFSPALELRAGTITTGTLLEEMPDLGRLARWPDPAYRTIQFSSYDRRSTTSEAPGWFSNADGFGGEPIPGFLKVLREPRDGQPGLYLLAEASGPGAIVRGWSAGMGGVLRVYLDPSGDEKGANPGALVWEGPAYDFLARRSTQFLKSAGLEIDGKDAFIQQDADYLPIPFARGLRITWEGKLNELHFYHVQVRLYPKETTVRTFNPRRDLQESEAQLRSVVSQLTEPATGQKNEPSKFAGNLEAGHNWTWTNSGQGSGAVRELKLRLQSEHLEAVLRGCLLRIAFDGSQRPQVEAPVGDFFASGPGVNPFSSLPFTVQADGTMTCRFVMPYEKSVRIEIVNYTKAMARFEGSVAISPWRWDENSLHFRAKWRVDHDLAAGSGVIDLPYLTVIGKGVFAGCAAMIMNPSGAPMAHGNWWGEGDEKFLVDGEMIPSTFGTGSEDYFNYSWSRPDLFDHPYCGQPLDSGPDTSGYVSNHRFQVMDAIPFEKSLAACLELWTHNPTPGMSYARITYHYARPNVADDHRGLTAADMKVPWMPTREPKALGGAVGARFHFPLDLHPQATGGRTEYMPSRVATQLKLHLWRAEKKNCLKFNLPIEKDGRTSIHLVALHCPDGATVRVLLDGQPIRIAGGADNVRLWSAHAPRVLNVHLEPVDLKAGSRELVLECVEAGPVGLDYVWVKGQ